MEQTVALNGRGVPCAGRRGPTRRKRPAETDPFVATVRKPLRTTARWAIPIHRPPHAAPSSQHATRGNAPLPRTGLVSGEALWAALETACVPSPHCLCQVYCRAAGGAPVLFGQPLQFLAASLPGLDIACSVAGPSSMPHTHTLVVYRKLNSSPEPDQAPWCSLSL